jgi:uncharacterized damage-inducible protein DinB
MNVISRDSLLEHWQGHRRLTRRVIEAFPDDRLFTYSIGGMRSFGALAMELVTMGAPYIRGVVTGQWDQSWDREARPKAELLALWDAATDDINRLWPQIPDERFELTIKAFGQWEGKTIVTLLYVIDNEIHHRGQGTVYLRSLGIEPPPFYER